MCFLIFAIVMGLLVSTNNAYSQNPGDVVPGFVLIKVSPGTCINNANEMDVTNFASEQLSATLTEFKCLSIKKVFYDSSPSDTIAYDMYGNQVKLIDLSGWLKLEFDQRADLKAILDKLSSIPEVMKAEFDYYGELHETFPSEIPLSDPNKQRQQWGLYNPDNRVGNRGHDINAPIAWDFQRGRNDVVVAVIDNGVDHRHLDLDPGDRSRVIIGRNVIDNNSNTLPSSGTASHGTQVASVIGAITNNGDVYGENSVAGVMWNCKIMPVKVLTSGTPGNIVSKWASGLN